MAQALDCYKNIFSSLHFEVNIAHLNIFSLFSKVTRTKWRAVLEYQISN